MRISILLLSVDYYGGIRALFVLGTSVNAATGEDYHYRTHCICDIQPQWHGLSCAMSEGRFVFFFLFHRIWKKAHREF